MLLVQPSSKISIPPFLPPTISLLFEPNSLSLALTHSDSSLSLFPSLPFPSLSSLPSRPQTLIQPPSSSSSFLLLQHDTQEPNNPRVLFLVAGPHKSGSQVLLRLYLLQRSNLFVKAQAFSNQEGIGFDPKLGILLDIDHGVSIKVVGSVNFFVVYSVSSKKVWVFGVKLVGDGDVVKLMRCAVIECCKPVWCISVSFGCLILGEEGGVRVFNLRQLVKGKVKKVTGSSLGGGDSDLNGKFQGKRLNFSNGVIEKDNALNGLRSRVGCNGFLEGKLDRHYTSSKQRSVKCREDSVDVDGCFLEFKRKGIADTNVTTVKAISIQSLTQKKFMILDSSGDLHILNICDHTSRLNIKHHIRHLPYSLKVQKMAVLTDIASKTHTVWLSDGFHSVHKLSLADANAAADKGDEDDWQDELMKISGAAISKVLPLLLVVQALFTGEHVWDLVLVGADVILILGRGNIYAYAIP